MKEPGLDQRHRDKTPPKAGEIQQKRSDTLNRNLSRPIPQFRSDATLGKMREETGKVSEELVRVLDPEGMSRKVSHSCRMG